MDTENEILETNDEFSIDIKKPQKLIKESRITAEKHKSIEQSTLELDRRQKSLIEIYRKEPKVTVRISPTYAKYFGKVMHVSINGISVGIRCDGKNVDLPESFATEVLRRVAEMDKYELRLNKMSDVSNNFEKTPGQINFFNF